MTARLKAQHDLKGLVETVLNDVVALEGAEFGCIQLLLDDVLWLLGERNLGRTFVAGVGKITLDQGVGCARAIRARQPVLIPNINKDKEFRPAAAAVKGLGVAAVHSTPL